MVSTSDKKPQADWESIERDYRAGILSVREIAAAHGVSHTGIGKRAKAHSWARDLKARIQAKADDLVSRAVVSSQVATGNPETRASDQAVVDANAEVILRVRLSHRNDIAASRTLAMELMAELRSVTQNRELFEQLGERMFDPDRNGVDKLNELYKKVIPHGSRTKTMKDLADTLKTLIALEREAFGLTVVGTTPNSYEQNLKDLAG